MQIFKTVKGIFSSFMGFYAIHLKYQRVKIGSKHHFKLDSNPRFVIEVSYELLETL